MYMRLVAEIAQVRAERDLYFAALTAIDKMQPNDYKTGQSHLPPAFREVNLLDAWRFVCRTVNGVLHNTDEHGRPLSDTSEQAVRPNPLRPLRRDVR